MNKEFFNAELYAIGEVLTILLRDGRTGRRSKSQLAITRCTKINI